MRKEPKHNIKNSHQIIREKKKRVRDIKARKKARK